MKKVLFLFTCLSLLWCGPAFAQLAEGGSGAEIAIPDIPGTSEAGTIQAPPYRTSTAPVCPTSSPPSPIRPTSHPGSGRFEHLPAGPMPTPWPSSSASSRVPSPRTAHPDQPLRLRFFRTALHLRPDEAAPVRPDYVIGPGDQLRIDVWGMVEGSWTVTVSRDGTITIPGSGHRRGGPRLRTAAGRPGRAVLSLLLNYEMSVTRAPSRT